MNECILVCHYCWGGEQKDILLVFKLVFAGLRGGFLQKISRLNGKEWPIKAG